MAVQILILSGARQGERVELDVAEFRAGAEPNCAVFFDPRLDADASGRLVWFRLMEDGWYVARAVGAVLVNQQAVNGPTRIRSGDVVRLSERGPDFSFSIVARVAVTKLPVEAQHSPASGTGSPIISAVRPAPMSSIAQISPSSVVPASVSPEPSVSDAGAASASAQLSAATAAVSSSRPPAIVAIAASPVPAGKVGLRDRWLIWLVGGLAVCVLLVFLSHMLTPSVIQVTVTPAPLPAERGASPAASGLSTEGPGNTLRENTTSEPTAKKVVSTEQQITEKLKDAIFLIQVEKTKHFWPFATCCAIGENTLLTTAREAAQLAEWQQQDFRIWVTNPARGIKTAVKDIRVHGVYTTLTDQSLDWIYFDVGLLTSDDKLPKTAALASVEELAKLREGLPVFCFGFAHEAESISEDQRIEPQLSPGRIFLITAPPLLPAHPRLLHVKGNIPANAYGSPIVNEQGKIVAVYGDPASLPEDAAKEAGGQPNLQIHYAPVLNSEMIGIGLKQQDTKIWVSPVSAIPEKEPPAMRNGIGQPVQAPPPTDSVPAKHEPKAPSVKKGVKPGVRKQ